MVDERGGREPIGGGEGHQDTGQRELLVPRIPRTFTWNNETDGPEQWVEKTTTWLEDLRSKVGNAEPSKDVEQFFGLLEDLNIFWDFRLRDPRRAVRIAIGALTGLGAAPELGAVAGTEREVAWTLGWQCAAVAIAGAFSPVELQQVHDDETELTVPIPLDVAFDDHQETPHAQVLAHNWEVVRSYAGQLWNHIQLHGLVWHGRELDFHKRGSSQANYRDVTNTLLVLAAVDGCSAESINNQMDENPDVFRNAQNFKTWWNNAITRPALRSVFGESAASATTWQQIDSHAFRNVLDLVAQVLEHESPDEHADLARSCRALTTNQPRGVH